MRGTVPGLSRCVFCYLLRPPSEIAVAAHRGQTACALSACEIGQNQRNTSVFKAFWPCSYYNLIVDPAHDSGCFHSNSASHFRYFCCDSGSIYWNRAIHVEKSYAQCVPIHENYGLQICFFRVSSCSAQRTHGWYVINPQPSLSFIVFLPVLEERIQ